MIHLRERRPVLIASVLLVSTFAAGGATGLAADRWVTARPAATLRITRDPTSLMDALRLEGEQRRQVEALLERSAPRSEAVLRQAAEQLRQLADSVDAELRTLLTPDQRTRLDSLRKNPVLILKRRSASGPALVDTVLRPGPGTIR